MAFPGDHLQPGDSSPRSAPVFLVGCQRPRQRARSVPESQLGTMRSVRALASVIARTASPASASASNTASSAKCSVQFPTSRVLAPTNVQLPPWSSARSFSTRGLISYPNTSTRVNGPIAAVINLNAHAYSKGNMGLAPVGMSLHARGMSSWFGFGKKKTEDVEPPPSSHDASSTSDGSSIEQIASATGDVGDASSSVTTTGLEAAQVSAIQFTRCVQCLVVPLTVPSWRTSTFSAAR